MDLTSAHSFWLAPLCVLLGGLLAWTLYRGSAEKHGWSRRVALLMALLRGLAVALIAFFLLEPMVRVWLREVRKPVLVIAHDGSASLMAAGDTAAVRGAYADALRSLGEELSERFEVRAFTYGQQVREGIQFDQRDGLTDMDQMLREVADRFSGPDLGAVVIDGDGIYNRGRDPRHAAERLGVPVHTIALGDTAVHADLIIKGADHNRIAFLGNEVPVVVRVEARHFAGARTRVSIRREGVELAGHDLSIPGDAFFTEVPLMIRPAHAGLQRFTVILRPLAGEAGEENNALDIFIDVVDDRRKVLLLAAAPHPDIAALRAAIDGMEGYEADLAYAGDFQGDAGDHDLLILHQLPTRQHDLRPLLQRAAERDLPVLFILGLRTDMVAFSSLGAGVEVSAVQRATTDAQAVVDRSFSLFTLEPELIQAIERFPPLQAPFGSYESAMGAGVLLRQKVGMVRTDLPLLSFQQQGDRHLAVLCGEGIWRWRLADQQMNRSSTHADQLIRKVVQFLALQVDKERFRVDHAPEFAEGEAVVVTAELYNAAFELVNGPDATITFTGEDGREYPHTFSRTANSYRLDAGELPPGHYSFTARTSMDGETFTRSGRLLVRSLVAERMSTVADHRLLADIAARTGGIATTPDGLDRIREAIDADPTLVARSYRQASFTDLIELRWIFFVLLGLLALEWVLRRRGGAY